MESDRVLCTVGHVSLVMDATIKQAPLPTIKSLTWSDVSYSVKVPKTKEHRVLLSHMYGSIAAGEMIGIMGGSGAGKSTLLNTLAGRIGEGTLTGSILVDGKTRDPNSWNLQCAYVEQDDVMFRNLTVFETISYSASLRLPSSMSKFEKRERVERAISELGLNGCRNTRIGDTVNRGISGGERKRVSIGIELVTSPQLLFLDEPTSGLDSFNSLNVISQLKSLTVKNKMITMMTIHQPRTSILDLFDKIILLTAGNTVWFGSTADALSHFEKLGYSLPRNTNPSDFFVDIITPDFRSSDRKEKSLARIESFKRAFAETREKHEFENHIPPILTMRTQIQWPSAWIWEFTTLWQRSLIDVLRDKIVLAVTFGQGIFMLVLDIQGGIQSRVGVMFFITLNNTFGNVMGQVQTLPIQRLIIKRERSAGSYRASSAFLAKVASSLPLPFMGVLLLTLPVYWMIGLQPLIIKWFSFICIIMVHVFAAVSLGIMVGSGAPTVQIGQIVAPLVGIIFVLFGGNFLNLGQIPEVFKWIQWISIVGYTNKALNQNEFDAGLVLNDAQFPSALDVISQFSLGTPSMQYCVIINFFIGVAFLILGYAFYYRTTAPLSRLK